MPLEILNLFLQAESRPAEQINVSALIEVSFSKFFIDSNFIFEWKTSQISCRTRIKNKAMILKKTTIKGSNTMTIYYIHYTIRNYWKHINLIGRNEEFQLLYHEKKSAALGLLSSFKSNKSSVILWLDRFDRFEFSKLSVTFWSDRFAKFKFNKLSVRRWLFDEDEVEVGLGESGIRSGVVGFNLLWAGLRGDNKRKSARDFRPEPESLGVDGVTASNLSNGLLFTLGDALKN